MSWSDRRRLILALGALPVLAACGFRPALAPEGPAAGLRGRVRADDPADAAAFAFVERLEDRLGPPGPGADLRLSYTIRQTQTDAGLTRPGSATRIRLAGELDYRLADAGGRALLSGSLRQTAAWSTTASGFATDIAAEDARRRLMVALADELVTRLLAAPLPSAR